MESNPYSSPAANLFGSTSGTSVESVSSGVINQLKRTKPWVRFFGVMMWIAVGFMMLGALGLSFGGGVMAEAFNKDSPGMGNYFVYAMIGFYVIFGILYIYPALKIWKYGTFIGKLVKSGNNADLENALDQQRAFWKFVGIMMIIMMLLYIVLIVVMVGFAVTAAASGGFPK